MLARLSSFVVLPGSRRRPRRAHRAGTHHSTASGYLRSAVAAVAISALGLGAAGAVSLTSSAQTAESHPSSVSVPSAFDERAETTSRDSDRGAVTDRAKALQEAADQAEQERNAAAAKDREKQLGEEAAAAAAASKEFKAAAKQAEEEANSGNVSTTTPSAPPTYTPPAATGAARVYPLTTYTLAAKFGQYGPWARWHTGTDFAAPIGTPIHAITTGIVTHVGYGAAAEWAGFYITILHTDGYSTLYAHQTPSSFVKVGDVVTTGQQIGIVGVTGRSFGPHCHVELYPPGVVPGDIYHAVDVIPYIKAKG